MGGSSSQGYSHGSIGETTMDPTTVMNPIDTTGSPVAPNATAPSPQAGTGPNVYDTSAAQIGQAGGIYGNIGQSGNIAQSMNAYINPYQQQVLDSSISRVNDNTQQNLNSVGASATAGGAFGGSRHGLVESQVYADANRQVGELSSNLNMQGFNTAAGLGNQDIANRMGAAQGLQSTSNQNFGYGQAIDQNLSKTGNQQQALLQSILDRANGQFDGAINKPLDALNIQLAAAAGNPLNSESTQTYKPGTMDYVSAGLGVASGMGGK